MSTLHKMIAQVRSALERKPAPSIAHDDAAAAVPLSTAARHAELAAQFARELERVGGVSCGLLESAAVRDRLLMLVDDEAVKRVVLGDGVTTDATMLARALTRAGVEVTRTAAVEEDARADLRARLANCDLGIVEADYAIAATGTFCMVATAERPSSLTILPPVNFIMVRVDRILPTLGDAIAAIGPARFAANRVALITGPSRTADIEKLIVIGVHGPKRLYAAMVTT